MSVFSSDVLRATMEMEYEGLGAIQNVFHYQNLAATVTDEEALDDIVEIMEEIAAILAALIAVLQVVQGVRVINVTQHTDVGFGQFGDTTPFTGIGQVQPKQCCLGLNLITSRLRVGGRKFFGAIVAATNTEGGNVEAAPLAALGLVGAHMIVNQVQTNSTWRAGVIATFDDVWLPFTSYTVPTTIITQRRRRTGQGV